MKESRREIWNLTTEEVKRQYGVRETGLTMSQVKEIREKNGENVLSETKQQSVIQVFFRQFLDLLVIILLVAAAVSFVSGNRESTTVICLVLLMNALLGTVQHYKARKSLESLKRLSAPGARVIREGDQNRIASREVVQGDLLLLEAGDMVVADGRILQNHSLQVNESSLTGESANVEKSELPVEGTPAPGDRINMVYSGSLVTYGRALVLVTATGMETELGKIAGWMNAAKQRKTPLQESLDAFGSKLAMIIMVISALIFFLCLYRHMSLPEALMFAVALAVAAIPEALGSIVTIVQALGTQKMAKEQAIIKELKAVESLGCVSVICSDKTGTLTQNRMTVQKVYAGEAVIRPEDLRIGQKNHRYLLYDAILTNDAALVDGKSIGDPTESALLEMFRRVPDGSGKDRLREDIFRDLLPRREEVPFDSNRKLMSTKYCLHGVPTVLTKGAVDVLLDRCTGICCDDGERPITQEDMERIKEQNGRFSQDGLRVLAFAYKESAKPLTVQSEYGYTFLGLVAMADPPREESAEAVERAKQAGVRTVMITGDHKVTAVAIAKQIGIFREGDLAVTGVDLDEMEPGKLEALIHKISVYARVSPEHKIRIVEMWQKKGHIVAMTGDGVNDAPALKKADIGVAMGITGTEVAKDAADMILSDDNFATILQAVANGRNVYRNIKNAVLFLLSGNTAGILAVLYTSLMGLPVPFAPVHLLFMNLLTDSLPAIAIGMEPGDRSVLTEKPRASGEQILTGDFLKRILLQGGGIAFVTLMAYHSGLPESPGKASTMAFAVLTLARLFHGFNCRNTKSLWESGLWKNPWSVYAFAGGVLFLLSVLGISRLREVFQIVLLSPEEWVGILCLAALPFVWIQTVRVCRGCLRSLQ